MGNATGRQSGDALVTTAASAVRWCCYIFQDLTETAGERGLSVIVANIGDGPSFLLQSRAVDHDQHLGNTDGLVVTVAAQQAIFCCPGCGVQLHRFYSASIEKLRKQHLPIT